MRSERFGATRRDVLRLFEGGSVVALGDGELLARFALARDEAAFEALVSKLGPMVLGVCRRMLTDPHDVDDAFQATFLVLVRRAGSIRDRDLVAPWLHGVATRVAKRARADSIRRSARERVAVVAEAQDEARAIESSWPELRAVIDEEIDRFPENHRRPVILCDVEGLTREEAALRLGWSLNMVRGRLERGRDRLRGRLTRRGLAPSAPGVGMTWLAASPNLSPVLLATTCRAACSFGVGRVGGGIASASVVALSEGVLKMMWLSKLKLGLAVMLSTGFVAGTGMIAAQGTGGRPGPAESVLSPAPAPAPVAQEPAQAKELFKPRPAAELARAQVEAARQRLKTQTAFYEEGRIAIDRLIDASRQMMQAEFNATETRARRVEASREHYDRLAAILQREEAELAIGRATESDVAEAKAALLSAELTLARELEAAETRPAATAGAAAPVTAEQPVAPPALARLNAERLEIARRIFKEKERLFRAGAIDDIGLMNAGKSLLEAEERAATTKAERIEAIQLQIKTLKSHLPAVEKLVQNGAMNHSEIDRARLEILDAEAHLIEVSGAPEGVGGGALPAPNGPVPTAVPGPSGASKGETLSPLANAVAIFNQNAMTSAVGRDQPALTEDEVIAAIRFYSDDNPNTIKGALDDFRMVSEKRDMPPGMRFVSRDMDDRNGEFVYEAWSIQIQIPNKTGGDSMIPIRSRVIRSLTLEEAIKYAQARRAAAIRAGTPEKRKEAFGMEEYIKSLGLRINQRGKPKSGASLPLKDEPLAR